YVDTHQKTGNVVLTVEGVESGKTDGGGREMALARVVSFTGVDNSRIDQLKSEMESGERPEGLNPTEVMILHDPDSQEALAVVLFDKEDDYRRGDEILTSMRGGDTRGQRTGVRKYNVPIGMPP